MLYFSPGVTVTELQKRGGLDEEAYAKVSDSNYLVRLLPHVKQHY